MKLLDRTGKISQRSDDQAPGVQQSPAEKCIPFDAALNLLPNRYSQGMRCKVGLQVAKGSFEEAEKAIHEGTGGEEPKRQAKDLSRVISADFDEFLPVRRWRKTLGR
ncbi:MAG: hypothetical protein NOF05_21865 [Candidatus Accumulibacter phosphatis]|uniref:Uncharacterized protein n=1 Tax=Candidatus Thiothrix phosphatis TaxID=3112415 RepID=A0ABU6CVK4_9GAMM|nr:hypothetical protein [Candidatus Thiothrix sp. Deng01]MCQ1551395.1 hypothetical protein [Candidatus Accumulibacter phosphatis]MEB4590865.1 hypothetical protein [Candidatus Thiothrix sp. Deng01]